MNSDREETDYELVRNRIGMWIEGEEGRRPILAALDRLAALASAPAEGYKLVPIEPTPEMLAAGCEAAVAYAVLTDDTRFSCERATYAAMLAAAPEKRREVREAPVAWQERHQLSANEWSQWGECSTPLPGAPLQKVIDKVKYEWRPLYAASVSARPTGFDAWLRGAELPVGLDMKGLMQHAFNGGVNLAKSAYVEGFSDGQHAVVDVDTGWQKSETKWVLSGVAAQEPGAQHE